MHTLFIGDLHLSADRPDITQAFIRFLDTQIEGTEALYILGDLFEVWVGDDLAEPFAMKIAQHLKTLSHQLPIYFIHGNRDFLLGQNYAELAGITLLPEVQKLSLYGRATVVLHGDSLCTLDHDYQRFRRFRSRPLVQWCYRHLPQQLRLNIAAKLRRNSQQQNQMKSEQIMDVTADEVSKLLAQSNASLMIHGHTHRPAIHELGDGKQRAVVGDWYQQGSVLKVSPDTIELQTLPFA
ncbi:UDP-2,3-diacylglucosamine diphosphatase [Shewanella dokdonensis]|uniref:UDP-2,3-diacylglucosamine hydrolase n=1 Tax=Shewanella dokdonensis TaxID=712036 RepID=A0ABX8DDK5_9GAMM|nr:UDP-2,3-diacylglucosamine diphosphatase [Shewanella dokdonensis]MCL1073368.1 UDP-2,3-diacylglucosamine diphosphatase [Shewanella dokdonensis]QVK22810.1 UDP-2,3-diacylglucosamine diphosphatase [Shewanella dokdonensis]